MVMNVSVTLKGASKLALGVGLWGIIMAMDAYDMLPNDTYGKVTKYMGLAAGALYGACGAMTIINGSA